MSVSPSIAKNTVMTYRSLHLIANKTVELVYGNAPECIIFKFKKNKIQNFLGSGHIAHSSDPSLGEEGIPPLHALSPRRHDSRDFGDRPPTAFLTNRTLIESPLQPFQ